MDAAARSAGAMINAVMLGAIAASGRLPMPVEAFEAAIRADGKAVEANLRGFAAGLAAARERAPAPRRRDVAKAHAARAESLADLEAQAAAFPGAADIVVEGLRRLAAWQDLAYARLYLERLRPIALAARGDERLLRETARHLAVRMSYEDVIRVAEEKIAPARIAGIVAKMGGKPGEPVAIVEFLKPGIEEFCQLLPPRLATRDPGPAPPPRLDRPLPLGDGGADHLRHRLSQVPAARQAQARSGATATATARSRRQSKPGSP